jgi:hypothetical protein
MNGVAGRNITVNLNVTVDANGEIQVFGEPAPTLSNTIFADVTLPASALWSQDDTAGLIQFWEPSTALGDIQCAYADKQVKAEAIASGLQAVLVGPMDARDPANTATVASPFDDPKYASNADQYRKHEHFGRLALAAYAHYIFGHQAATSAITNDKAFMDAMMSLTNGTWNKSAANVLSAGVQADASASNANIALRLANAIATKAEGLVSAATKNDLGKIVAQVLGQDATRAMTKDNNQLAPDLKQLLRFYPGDKIVVNIQLTAPTVNVATQGNKNIIAGLYDKDKLTIAVENESYSLVITLA